MDIRDIYWHDSVILNILIDRKSPGKIDTIQFEVDWQDIGLKKIVFEDIFWAKLDLNMGMIVQECFDSAYIANDDDLDVVKFYKKLGNFPIPMGLMCYVLKLLSTGSEIKILCRGFKLID
jgi:hypothetical protein